MKLAKPVLAFVLTVLLVSPAAAELENLDGSEWVNEDANWSLTFQTGANYSYSNITVVNETLQIQDNNISTSHDSNETVNTTLYTYDLSSPSLNEEVLRLEVDAPSSTGAVAGLVRTGRRS